MLRRLCSVVLLVVLASLPLSAAPLRPGELAALRRIEAGLQAQVDELLTEFGENRDLTRYEQEYRQVLQGRRARSLPPATLAAELVAAPLVLLADTHTSPEAQRRTVEVISTMKAGAGELTLVIEWIDRSFQAEVDAYLAGHTTLGALRKAIRFDRTWAFSWRSYSQVLVAARRAGVRVLLVESLLEHRSLATRDRDIAARLAEDRRQDPSRRYLVVYGGFHLLGRDHLSERLAQVGFGERLVLVDEAPALYWSALGRLGDPEQVDTLRVADGLWFVRSGSPLERLRAERDYYLEVMERDLEDLDAQLEELAELPSVARFEHLHRELR